MHIKFTKSLMPLWQGIPAILLATFLAGAPSAMAADDFELAMVIKSTTNPYYNATLKGAQIAAKEIGGSAKNYGPTQSSAQAQVDIINNLGDRHASAIAVATCRATIWPSGPMPSRCRSSM